MVNIAIETDYATGIGGTIIRVQACMLTLSGASKRFIKPQIPSQKFRSRGLQSRKVGPCSMKNPGMLYMSLKHSSSTKVSFQTHELVFLLRPSLETVCVRVRVRCGGF